MLRNRRIIEARNLLANVHLQRKEIDEAKGYVDEVIKVSPKNTEAHFLKGQHPSFAGRGLPRHCRVQDRGE